jgi:CheY-like chemotaxis protein
MKRLDGKRILLVDDEEMVRTAIELLLVACGAVVTQSPSGEDALQVWKQDRFDCVLTDYKMPNMRGDELARTIKTANPAQRVVMVTGFAPEVTPDGKLPWFLDVLLHKPCSMPELLAAIAPP